MIPDIEKFLPVTIFKMATTIPHKFNIVRFQRPELIPDIEKFLQVHGPRKERKKEREEE
jgi:hypothetical protein